MALRIHSLWTLRSWPQSVVTCSSMSSGYNAMAANALRDIVIPLYSFTSGKTLTEAKSAVIVKVLGKKSHISSLQFSFLTIFQTWWWKQVFCMLFLREWNVIQTPICSRDVWIPQPGSSVSGCGVRLLHFWIVRQSRGSSRQPTGRCHGVRHCVSGRWLPCKCFWKTFLLSTTYSDKFLSTILKGKFFLNPQKTGWFVSFRVQPQGWWYHLPCSSGVDWGLSSCLLPRRPTFSVSTHLVSVIIQRIPQAACHSILERRIPLGRRGTTPQLLIRLIRTGQSCQVSKTAIQ